MEQKPEIVKDATNPQPDQIIAKSIIDLAAGMDKLLKGPLKRDAIVLLLQHKCGLGRNDIKKVLDAIPLLKDFVRQPENKRQ